MEIQVKKSAFQAMMEDGRLAHSEFQIEHFILKKCGITPWGRYQQALREIRARVKSLKQMYRQLGGATGEEAIALLELFGETERELKTFLAAALEEKRVLGDLTEERKAELEKDYWAKVLRFRVECEQAAERNRISLSLVESIAALPEDIRSEVTVGLDGPIPVLPEAKTLPPVDVDVRGLIEWA